jgi:hypothetical protein
VRGRHDNVIQRLQFLSASLICSAMIVFTSPATDQKVPSPSRLALHFVLEKRNGSSVRVMPQKHVFHEGDMVRLRIRSEADGHLYVLDRSSSGTLTVLFPDSDSADDRIKRNHDYILPSAKNGWFRIVGPPGYETLYLLVSSDPATEQSDSLLVQPPVALSVTSSAPDGIVPRCDDDLWRSRGDCLDVNAGVQALKEGESVPDPLGAASSGASRDIAVNTVQGETAVSSAAAGRTAVVYEFRIAHH